MNKNEIVTCVTGHRPNKLFGYNIDSDKYKNIRICMSEVILKIIIANLSFTRPYEFRFINGGALGIDMIFAEETIKYRNSPIMSFIRCECAIPCLDQEKNWNKSDQERYHNILNKMDRKTILYNGKYPGAWCMQKRNEYMIDKSDYVLAFYDGVSSGGTKNAVDYAKSKNKEIICINPKEVDSIDLKKIVVPRKIIMGGVF